MNYTTEVQAAIAAAFLLAEKNKNRYLTPEHLMYGLCFDGVLRELYESHGGNIKKLETNLLEYIEENAELGKKDGEFEMTEDFKLVLTKSIVQAQGSGRGKVSTAHVLSAILSLEDSYAAYFFLSQGVDSVEILGALSRKYIEGEQSNIPMMNFFDDEDDEDDEDDFDDFEEFEGKQDWRSYVESMSQTCKDKKPLIGREMELERSIQILCRMDKNNVIYIGEAGVGKTAIAYGLAQCINENKVPEPLREASMFGLDTATLMAGTSYRGEFEERLKWILDGLVREEKKPIVYIDEIHNIVGTGAVEGSSMDMSNILKPYLADGKIRFIGATTFEEYKKHFAKNSSLMRRFQNVEVKEPSEEETIKILNGLKSRYEKFHGVKYGKGVIEYAVAMSKKYMNERYLPDKAIDLIDEAGAYRKLHPLAQKTQSIQKKLIDDILSDICKIPKQMVEQNDIEKLSQLEQNFGKLIFGQQEAVEQVLNAVKFAKAGLNDENKPMASLLFVGPTGVGKTEVAKTLANQLGIGLIRFDMSEYAEKHTVAKLIGSPAGYVGYEDGGLLTDAIRKQPHAVLLLDEIEKAHPDIFNILLQVMDYATLSDSQGRKADFRNVILIMTSNAGAAMATKNAMGFGIGSRVNSGAILEAVKHTFQPEFRNRLTKIVVFNGMDDAMATEITQKKLRELKEQLEKRKIILTITDAAIEWIKQAGITKEYGAREIDRTINDKVKPLLVNEILYGYLKNGGTAIVDRTEDRLCLRKK